MVDAGAGSRGARTPHLIDGGIGPVFPVDAVRDSGAVALGILIAAATALAPLLPLLITFAPGIDALS
ncbi:hypothetical protein GTW59_07445 [Streptomyces sp. SID89]|nr:hypothetical protein [Streptomyces sp. SID89]